MKRKEVKTSIVDVRTVAPRELAAKAKGGAGYPTARELLESSAWREWLGLALGSVLAASAIGCGEPEAVRPEVVSTPLVPSTTGVVQTSDGLGKPPETAIHGLPPDKLPGNVLGTTGTTTVAVAGEATSVTTTPIGLGGAPPAVAPTPVGLGSIGVSPSTVHMRGGPMAVDPGGTGTAPALGSVPDPSPPAMPGGEGMVDPASPPAVVPSTGTTPVASTIHTRGRVAAVRP